MTTHPARHDLVEALRKARPHVAEMVRYARSERNRWGSYASIAGRLEEQMGDAAKALTLIDAALASEAASQVPADD